MDNVRKALILAAHPDDETLGCGGTIAKLISEKCEVHLITFTDGISARNSLEEHRAVQTRVVCELVEIADYKICNYPDNKLDTVPLLTLVK